MKALSLWQPWATLFVHGWKRIETRGWSTQERGLIAIAATASLPPLGREMLQYCDFQNALFHCVPDPGLGVEPRHLPYGAILGVADLTECVQMTEESVEHRREYEPIEDAFGDYRPGRWEWHFRKVTRFPRPIPCKGHQKLWEVRGQAARELAERLEEAAMPPEQATQLALGDPQLSDAA